jgi:hypothetical protein
MANGFKQHEGLQAGIKAGYPQISAGTAGIALPVRAVQGMPIQHIS